MDRRERVVDRKADEILKKFTSDIVKIYDEEAKELMAASGGGGHAGYQTAHPKAGQYKKARASHCGDVSCHRVRWQHSNSGAESRCMARLVARPLDGGKRAGY